MRICQSGELAVSIHSLIKLGFHAEECLTELTLCCPAEVRAHLGKDDSLLEFNHRIDLMNRARGERKDERTDE